MIRTVLISGRITKAQLERRLQEVREICTHSSADQKLVFVFDSPGGDGFASRTFVESLLHDDSTRYFVERAEVKIYCAYSAAAYLAFSVGSLREIEAEGKIGFHMGELNVDFWEIDKEGRLSTPLLEKYRLFHEALLKLLATLRLASDPKLNAELWASGWLYLTAEECLERRLVHGLF
jgi:hypothetical protein